MKEKTIILDDVIRPPKDLLSNTSNLILISQNFKMVEKYVKYFSCVLFTSDRAYSDFMNETPEEPDKIVFYNTQNHSMITLDKISFLNLNKL